MLNVCARCRRHIDSNAKTCSCGNSFLTGPFIFTLGIVSGVGTALIVLSLQRIFVDFFIDFFITHGLQEYAGVMLDVLIVVLWGVILGHIIIESSKRSFRKYKPPAKSIPNQAKSKEVINTGPMISFGKGGGVIAGLAIIMVLELSTAMTTEFDQLRIFVVGLAVTTVAEVWAWRLRRPAG